MTEPTIVIIVGAAQAVILAIIAAVLKVWQDRISVIRNQVSEVRQDLSGKIEVVRTDVNSKMAEMMKLKGESEKAKGNLEGRAAAKAEEREKDI